MTLESIQDYLEESVFITSTKVYIAAGGDVTFEDFYVNEFGHTWTCTDYNCENCEAEFYCKDLNAYLHGVIKTEQTFLGEVFNFVIHYAD